MMITLEIGKRYVLRSGGIVEVIYNDSNPANYGGISPFIAVMREPAPGEKRGEIYRYEPNGRWYANTRQLSLDIVGAVEGQKNILVSTPVLG